MPCPQNEQGFHLRARRLRAQHQRNSARSRAHGYPAEAGANFASQSSEAELGVVACAGRFANLPTDELAEGRDDVRV